MRRDRFEAAAVGWKHRKETLEEQRVEREEEK
jgi:hypothetical protein